MDCIANFCRNIRDLRITNNLSKKEMAKKLNVSLYVLNKLEKGEMPKRLSVDIIYTIIKNFNVKASDLFE